MKILNYIILSLFIASCSSIKKEVDLKKDVSVGDCLYYNHQKMFILQEDENKNLLIFSEMDNGFKSVFKESKRKMNTLAIKVKCEKGREEEVIRFLENHY